MSPDRPLAYSATTIDHFRHPRNVGRLEDADAVGSVDDRATENWITLYLRVAAGRIAAARFRTFGCSSCVAASSIVTELVQGRTAAECRALDGGAVDRALGGLPPAKRHCAELAARALAEALDALEVGRVSRPRPAPAAAEPPAEGARPVGGRARRSPS